ncbi:MAG TPA: glycoside hydrolase family 30 beta sandwich domain-containing protein [Capsulimonadaceae bacterium]
MNIVRALALLLVLFAMDSHAAIAANSSSAAPIAVYLTIADKSKLLSREADLTWSSANSKADDLRINVNDRKRFQTIDGFGATLTETGILDAPQATKDEIMRRLFSPTEGIGLSFVRVKIGGVDSKTCDDTKNNEPDPDLKNFSIDDDKRTVLPVLHEAAKYNPALRIMGSPWSAPAWMKTTGKLGSGKLLPKYYATYASYFVRWIKAWQSEGMKIDAVTMQNEPHFEPGWYLGMRMEASDQAAFAKELGPAFKNAGIDTKIICWDHNQDEPFVPINTLDDDSARKWIAGTAFHGYAGNPYNIELVRRIYPDKAIYYTELTGTYPSDGYGGSLMWQMTNCGQIPLQSGSRCVMLWQLTRTMAETAKGDRPVVRLKPASPDYDVNGEYYVLGQFSKFVLPGAVRIECTSHNASSLYATAFINPNGDKVLVANSWGHPNSFEISWNGRHARYDLPSNSAATFIWH